MFFNFFVSVFVFRKFKILFRGFIISISIFKFYLFVDYFCDCCCICFEFLYYYLFNILKNGFIVILNNSIYEIMFIVLYFLVMYGNINI